MFSYRAAYCSLPPVANVTIGDKEISASCNCGGKTVTVVQGGGLTHLSNERNAQLECVGMFVAWYDEASTIPC